MSPLRNRTEIFLKDFRVTFAGNVLQLSRKEFDFYCLLALKRLEDRNGGYVQPDEVLEMPTWSKNTIDSVGKQIRRHIQELGAAGLTPIEARRKVKGPFRLRSDTILLDARKEEIAAHLQIGTALAHLTESELKRFYGFIVHMWKGSRALNDGRLEQALKYYQASSEIAVLPHHRILAFSNVGRVLERRTRYAEALAVYKQAVLHLSEVKQDHDWAEAKLAAMAGLLYWRTGDITEASTQYATALKNVATHRNHQIAGEAYNGMGLVAKEREQLTRALAMYHQALECWVLAEDYYGIQATYFNIGRVNSIVGDRLWRAGQKEAARQAYAIALHWVRQCITLCNHMVIADDTSDDRILLSHIERRMGHLVSAHKAALDANEMAKRAKNERCIALSYRELAAVYIERGQREEVMRVIGECKQTVKPAALKFLNGDDLLERLAQTAPDTG